MAESGAFGGFTSLTFGEYSEAVETQNKRIPPGTYEVVLHKWEFIESNVKGTPGILFELRVVEADDPEWNNWLFYHNTWLSGTAWSVKNTVLGLGGEATSGQTLIPEEVRDGTSEALNGLIGEQGTAQVEDEEYQGKKQAKIKRFILK